MGRWGVRGLGWGGQVGCKGVGVGWAGGTDTYGVLGLSQLPG